ncbi:MULTISPECIES: energy-coupling factor transporter transmembrane protein EcfT [Acidianus]|uniref:Cobalt ABC transporter n=1 Tax=Candidatus Acidianus copahuensis TaxID=1160895 RepID=A0A031LK46_9CREN|nr:MULTISPECIES: energy-coupling factor transporter transmembrane component T [Acidianus]EZQ01609.1 cobalt ABC transporter [Candidatus Acidianus copahuensis]NON61575.1 energy-coupling factor transporter transmembrane protein EcfT [Acidianus sp. RZ1]
MTALLDYIPLIFFIITIFLVVYLLTKVVGLDGIATAMEYKKGKSSFHQINPLVKIFFEISIFLVLLRAYELKAGLFLSIAILSVLMTILLFTPNGKERVRYSGIYAVAVFLAYLWNWLNSIHSTGLVLWVWPSWFSHLMRYSQFVTSGSLIKATIMSIENPIIAISLAGITFISTTSVSDLFRSFSEVKVPLWLTLIFSVFLKVIPQTFRELDNAIKLQIFRGLGFGKPQFLYPLIYIYAFFLSLIPTFVHMAKSSKNMAMALDLKGFRAFSSRTSLKVIGFHWRDLIVLIFSIGFIGIFAFLE